MRISCGLPLCVRTMNGSKVVVAPVMVVLIVDPAALVPHQLLVAVTVVPWLRRLLPFPPAVLPASRLKLMVMGPAVGNVPPDPVKIPPPSPVALFPVIVTLVNVAESGFAIWA